MNAVDPAAASPAQAFPASPVAAPTGADARHDRLVANVLAAGLLATAAIGAPGQFVLPDTIKSVTAALFAFAALALFAWRQSSDRSMPLRWHWFLAIPFALALFAFASMAWAPASTAAVEGARWLVVGTVVALGANAFARDDFRWVARAAHWGILVVSAFALVEFWLGWNIFPSSAAPGGNFGNRNLYAEYVAVTFPFSLWLLLRGGNLRESLLRGAAIGFVLLGLMATGTRSAMIAVLAQLAATAVFLLAYRARGGFAATDRRALLGGWAAALTVILLLGSIPSRSPNIIEEHQLADHGMTAVERAHFRLNTLRLAESYSTNSSFGFRVAGWHASRAMVAQNPLLGVGAGAWNTASPLYLPDDLDTEFVWMAHNEPLQLVAEYGLVGWLALGGLATLLVLSMGSLVRDLSRDQDADMAFARWTAVLAVVAFGVVSLAGLPLHQSAPTYVFAIGLGLLVAWLPMRTISGAQVPAAAWWSARAGSLALVLVALVLGIQGMRSDHHMRRARGILGGLEVTPGLTPEQVAAYRAQAVDHLRKSLAIFPDHGVYLLGATQSLANLGDAQSVVWLGNLQLATRPHVAQVQCNLTRAYADLNNFESAQQILTRLQQNKPRAPCIGLTRFVYDYKRGDFAAALATGRGLIQRLTPTSDKNEARYLVDMSYRAAVRVPDPAAAIDILEVRASRWPELRAGSYFLMAQLMVQRAGNQVDAQATAAFRKALQAATPQEAAGMVARIPEAYRAQLR